MKRTRIQGDGTSLWHLTFNEDFAIGYAGLIGNRHAIGEAFHITGDEVLTWNQIYQTIADALGVELKSYHVSSDYLSAVGDKYGFYLTKNNEKKALFVTDLCPFVTEVLIFLKKVLSLDIYRKLSIRTVAGRSETPCRTTCRETV